MSLRLVLLLACATSTIRALVVPQQLSPGAGKHDGNDLLDINQLDTKPAELAAADFSVIDSTIAALTQYVAKSHSENEEALVSQVAEFGKLLAKQRTQNKEIESKIDHLRGQISRKEDKNQLTRDTATKLLESTTALVQSIHRIEANLTFAEEFAHTALVTAESALVSPTVKILADLDKNDEARRVESEHKLKLQSLHRSVLLQVSISAHLPRAVSDDASDLLNSLQSSLSDMSTLHAAGLERLKANFTEELKVSQSWETKLLKEQALLEAELQREVSLGSELEAAVAHLRETKAKLETRSRGLEAFASRLGNPLGMQSARSQNYRTAKYLAADASSPREAMR